MSAAPRRLPAPKLEMLLGKGPHARRRLRHFLQHHVGEYRLRDSHGGLPLTRCEAWIEVGELWSEAGLTHGLNLAVHQYGCATSATIFICPASYLIQQVSAVPVPGAAAQVVRLRGLPPLPSTDNVNVDPLTGSAAALQAGGGNDIANLIFSSSGKTVCSCEKLHIHMS